MPHRQVLFMRHYMAYIPEFKNLSDSSLYRRYSAMRDFYNKPSHQLLTFVEVADYLGVNDDYLRLHIPKNV